MPTLTANGEAEAGNPAAASNPPDEGPNRAPDANPPVLSHAIDRAAPVGDQDGERTPSSSGEPECSALDTDIRLRTHDDYQPIVKVAPRYPPEAAITGLTGYVLVEYTVTKSGNTREIHVMDASSPIFEHVAIESVGRYRYQAQPECGDYVDARLKTLIVFGDGERQDLPIVDDDTERLEVTSREDE